MYVSWLKRSPNIRPHVAPCTLDVVMTNEQSWGPQTTPTPPPPPSQNEVVFVLILDSVEYHVTRMANLFLGIFDRKSNIIVTVYFSFSLDNKYNFKWMKLPLISLFNVEASRASCFLYHVNPAQKSI